MEPDAAVEVEAADRVAPVVHDPEAERARPPQGQRGPHRHERVAGRRGREAVGPAPVGGAHLVHRHRVGPGVLGRDTPVTGRRAGESGDAADQREAEREHCQARRRSAVTEARLHQAASSRASATS